MGLCLLGPGELIHRQIHVKSHIPDNLCDSLVRQGKGIKGPREEGDLLPGMHVKFSHHQPVLGDKPVQVGKAGCPVKMSQLSAGIFLQLEKDLGAGRVEDRTFLGNMKQLRTKYLLSHHQQSFLPDNLPIVCHAGEKHSHQPLPAVFPCFRILLKPGPVHRIMLQHGTCRINDRCGGVF